MPVGEEMTAANKASHWWSDFKVERGQGMHWDLGAFRLVIFHKEGEWLLRHENTESTAPDTVSWQVDRVTEAPSDGPNLVRFVADQKTNLIRLVPRAADRSVVVRPHLPLHLLAGQKSEIYVSSPVWVEVTVGQRRHRLCEIPVRALSDTWFGPNTREGEVAYALRTRARVQLAEMPMRTYRIITPIRIENEGHDSLLIDRMNLPVPYLSVYAADDGFLWTETVKLIRSEGSEMASLEVGKGAPPEAKRTHRLSEPRQTAEANFLVRAFTGLFAPFQEED